jgi:leucyl-tRNA synthetase
MLTAFSFRDQSGRLVPADEVVEDGDKAVHKATGEELERVIAKMSKSLKNVVNPDDVVAEYGVDAFRIYEMFMGPLGDSKPWNPRDVSGSRRFLDRVWRLFIDQDGDGSLRPNVVGETAGTEDLERSLNVMLQRIDSSFDGFNFNTAIAGMMTFVNEASKQVENFNKSQAERFVCALSPFAPHISEELWSRMGHTGGVSTASWPQCDESKLVEDTLELVVQVMGKLRARVQVSAQATTGEIEAAAMATVPTWLEGKTIVKTIVVPGRLVNFVVR